MKHLFVPYEIAVMAKEAGFNEPCLAGFLPDREFAEPDSELNTFRNRNRSGGEISAPLYQQLTDWFREKHNTFIQITFCEKYGLSTEVISGNGEFKYATHKFKEYYEAYNAALIEAFKLIQK